jgi:hypothetical protein
MEPIEVGRLEDRVAQAGKVPHPLVVGHDQNDIGSAALKRFGSVQDRQRSEEQQQ